jgi:hypothetical protein
VSTILHAIVRMASYIPQGQADGFIFKIFCQNRAVDAEIRFIRNQDDGFLACTFPEGTLDLQVGDKVKFTVISDKGESLLTKRTWVSFDLIERQAGWQTVYKQS